MDTFLGQPEVFWVGIQAISAVAGFAGLIFYAADTARIRKATISQSDASRRPFFELRLRGLTDLSGVVLVNRGAGVAVAAQWRFMEGSKQLTAWNRLGSMTVKSHRTLRLDYGINYTAITMRNIATFQGIRIEYSDTAGKQYWSEIRLLDNPAKYLDRDQAITTGPMVAQPTLVGLWRKLLQKAEEEMVGSSS